MFYLILVKSFVRVLYLGEHSAVERIQKDGSELSASVSASFAIGCWVRNRDGDLVSCSFLHGVANMRSFASASSLWLCPIASAPRFLAIASAPRFLAMTVRRTDHALSRLTGHSFESRMTRQVRRVFGTVSRLDCEQSIDGATFSSIVMQANV